jgi:hypothetical protein
MRQADFYRRRAEFFESGDGRQDGVAHLLLHPLDEILLWDADFQSFDAAG